MMAILQFVALAAVLPFCTATGPRTTADSSLAYLLERISSSAPVGSDPKFDCEWRKFATEYAVYIQPWITVEQQQELFDALQLATLCGMEFRPVGQNRNSEPDASAHATSTADVTIYVAPDGSDSNSGSISSPKKTLLGALNATRAARASINLTAAIFLRNGTYYLQDTVVLSSEDSFLTIAAYPGEDVVVSGGRLVQGLSWAPIKSGSPIFSTKITNDILANLPNGFAALRLNGLRATLARFPNANPELDLFPIGYVLGGEDWHAPTYRGAVCNPRQQCGQSVNVTIPVTDAWHGMYQNWTVGYGGACEVYDPPYSPWCSGDFYLERQFPEMHTRHPSGLSTTSLPHAPYAKAEGAIVHAWRPGHWYTWMFEIDSGSFANHTSGWVVSKNNNNIFGLIPVPRTSNNMVHYLGNFSTQDECFAACNRTKGCSTWTWHDTKFDPDWAFGCYSRVDGVWAPVPEDDVISGYYFSGTHSVFEFGAGGTQGGEGSDTAGEWFIEDVFEELDAENEYYFDEATRTLYLWYNGTGAPPSDVVVPTLAVLLYLQGSQEAPIQSVTIANMTFTANRPTFMDPRSNPSGGDWSLERLGAILLEGTDHALVTGNTFVRLDSNAVFLSAYNRNAVILRNHFVWLGQSAIASWGRTLYNDGTNGDQPRFTTVEGNWIHEIGHYQKQSSCYFQAESAQLRFVNNICFNIPRAGINVNDGFGGDNEIANNLLFNTCRESSDHGAFNSWDRLPYITDVADGHTPSTVPAQNDVHHNFIVANYAADGGCLDNDDGSSYYYIHHNFCVYGGHKSDFDGHSKTSAFNLHIYPNVYGITCLRVGAQILPPKGYAESYHSNICILPDPDSAYVSIDGIDPAAGPCLGGSPSALTAFLDGLVLANNTIYVPQGNAVTHCGDASASFAEIQRLGYDRTSTVSANVPDGATIVEWGRLLLDVPGARV